MIVFISDSFNKKVNFVAYYQIIGGAIGFLLALWVMVSSEGGGLLILLSTLGLYTFSMYCGKMLLDGKVKDGLRFSTINQVIQTINFALFGYAFNFVAGLNLTVGINYTTDLKFIYNISLSQFKINLNSQKELVIVGINLIALSLIFIIGNLMVEYQEESKKP
jgi:hypothetical protein